jgi:predicted nucleotidyltransferase
MITQRTIHEMTCLLQEAASPTKIVLFGSYAREQAHEDSDLDVLVIKREVKDRRQEMVRLRRVLLPLRIPVDLIVVSEQEVREWGDLPGTALYPALNEGRVLYDAS